MDQVWKTKIKNNGIRKRMVSIKKEKGLRAVKERRREGR
jgi:hypothetical protein